MRRGGSKMAHCSRQTRTYLTDTLIIIGSFRPRNMNSQLPVTGPSKIGDVLLVASYRFDFRSMQIKP